MTKTPVITFQDVSFAYEAAPIVENVNLTISRGELLCVVGPNGGGKTTLLKLMLGLIKPDTGRVRVFDLPPTQARHRIGYVPQHNNYDPQFPITALDIVLMGRLQSRWRPRYSRNDKNIADDALAQVGLADIADHTFSQLSGGQRQRILIARALATEPEILLLDEPTANIDLAVESRLHETLAQLKSRMTILMVTHDLGFVSDIVASVVCVNRQVVVHPTSDITGEIIHDIYGEPVRMIRHDHRCSEGGHQHG